MESFQQPAFCFNMPARDFDPNQIPSDGEQYLQSVIFERNKCPAVVVKPFKINHTKTKTDEQQSKQLLWEKYALVNIICFFSLFIHSFDILF